MNQDKLEFENKIKLLEDEISMRKKENEKLKLELGQLSLDVNKISNFKSNQAGVSDQEGY